MPFKEWRFGERHAVAREPVALPINTLLALPSKKPDEKVSGLFNLTDAVNLLLGSPGWQRAKEVLHPKVLAPGWSHIDLLGFLSGAPPRERREPVPAEELLGLRIDAGDLHGISFAIRHFAAGQSPDARTKRVEWEPTYDSVLPFLARRTMVASGKILIRGWDEKTRLVILQTHAGDTTQARQLAELAVRRHGPAVLIVACDRLTHANEYLTDLYARIIHNQPLTEAAKPKDEYDVSAELFLGADGDKLLSFDPLVREVSVGKAELTAKHAEFRNAVQEQRKALEPYLHKSIAAPALDGIDALSTRVGGRIHNLPSTFDFQRETKGVYSLLDVSGALPSIERDIRDLYPHLKSLEEQLRGAARKAPRVLNANFADPSTGRLLRRGEAIVCGDRYHLLVDVGPRWSTVPSIVNGSAEFPEKALADDGKEGFAVQVLFIGEELEPAISSAWIWVPRKSGRSIPYDRSEVADGKAPGGRPQKHKPGPVAIPLMAPALPGTETAPRFIWSRLSLYYEGNLLQSAAVKVGVARSRENIAHRNRNEVRVDYALTNTLLDVEERCAPRRVSFVGSREDGKANQVSINITLNDNGLGDHRIIVVGRPAAAGTPPPGWTQYNPKAASELLAVARQELLNCFFMRNPADGSVIPDSNALGLANAKSYDQFRFDLRELSKVGSTLYDRVTGQIRTAGGIDMSANWTRKLNAAVASSTVIQIARTSQAEYTLPWALMYDIPMTGKKPGWCKVLDDWKDEARDKGVRSNPALVKRCIYADDKDHLEDIYCPYGFWGLRHVIEQPLSQLPPSGEWAPGEVAREFARGDAIDFAIAATRDAGLDLPRIAEHLQGLGVLPRVKLRPPSPASDIDAARQAIASTDVVYFLCHGEIDDTPPLPLAYLGIGPRDNDPNHRIYVKTVQAWRNTEVLPNLADWEKRRPLVFINACKSTDLGPEQILSFVTGFNYARASGILGTEVSVKVPVATEVADTFLAKLFGGMGAGQALHETRWQLANKGNLLGLAYTLYAMGDLRTHAANRVAAARLQASNAAQRGG